MSRQEVTFDNPHGDQVAGVLEGPEDAPAGVVLCSHFTGNKDIGHLHRMAIALADAGLRTLRFDYTDCLGDSEGACETKTVTHQVQDTLAALGRLDEECAEQLGLWGHSLGGLTAIATACEAEDLGAISAVAAPAKLEWETLFKSKAEEWKEQGYVTFDTWQQGQIHIDYGFYEDLKRYDATQIVQNVDAPIQVVVPEDDELVDPKNSEGIYEAAGEPKRFDVIEDADHLFTDREREDEMIDVCCEWFSEHL